MKRGNPDNGKDTKPVGFRIDELFRYPNPGGTLASWQREAVWEAKFHL